MTNLSEEPFKKLASCIHCGMCLPTCPTYRITGSEAESPRGRLYLMQAFYEGTLNSPEQLSTHLDPCLGCLACVTACPSGVEYGELLMASREKLVEHQPQARRWIRRFLLQNVLPKPGLLKHLATLTRFYTGSGLQFLVRKLHLAKLGGPLGKLEQFTPHIQPSATFEPGRTYGQNRKGRVALFTGCIMNAAYQQVHQASIDVLTANGYEVVIPPQTCCGALAHHAGEMDIAVSLARENVEKLLPADVDWIVINAAGCGSTLKEYHHMLHHHPDSETFTHKVVDILELLAKHPLEEPLHSVPLTVTYHAACHLHHAQKIHEEPYHVLRQIPELNLIPLTEAEMCCGSAGIYNLAHPDLSLAILKEKMVHLEKTGAEFVLASNPGCLIQLDTGIRQAGLPMKTIHPIELIAKAYQETPVVGKSLRLVKR